MTEEEAVAVIGRTPLIEVTTAAMQDIKRMRDQCLNAGIPAMMERPKGNCGSS